MKNKKALGFGKLFAILVFILSGLTLYYVSSADQKVQTSIGVQELYKIDSRNIKSYFYDSMRLGLNQVVNESVKNSFTNNPNCMITSNGIFILDKDCNFDPGDYKEKLINEIAVYVEKSLEKINFKNVDVICKIKDNLIRCESSEIILNSSRTNSFFSYEIYKKLNLNDSINLNEKINLENINNIIEQAKTCSSITCSINSEYWTLKNIEENNNYLIFSLESKKDFAFEKEISKINWKFAINKK